MKVNHGKVYILPKKLKNNQKVLFAIEILSVLH